MKKLKALLFGLLAAAALVGYALADAIAPPDSELSIRMSGFFSDPLVIVIIAAVIVVAVLIVVGAIRTARGQKKRRADERVPRDEGGDSL